MIGAIKKALGIRQGYVYYNSIEMVERVRFFDFVEGLKSRPAFNSWRGL